jgi:hypothetical protein
VKKIVAKISAEKIWLQKFQREKNCCENFSAKNLVAEFQRKKIGCKISAKKNRCEISA